MRGEAERQIGMLTLVTPEQRVRGDHPLRHIKPLADAVLKDLSPTFEKMYSRTGRPSIPPERLLKASLLMGFYTVRSERLFCEQLDYNLLFRWFLDMGLDEPSFDHSSFSRNRARLLEARCGAGVLRQDRGACAGPGADERRPFYGGRNADRGLGLAQEFQAQRRQQR